MTRKWIQRKSWIALGLAFLLTSFAIATQTPKNPSIELVTALQSKADQVFLFKAADYDHLTQKKNEVFELFKYVGDDKKVSLDVKEYQDLLNEFLIVKNALEKTSYETQTLAFDDPKMKGLAHAARDYLEQQRRLYFNFFRNWHQNTQKPSPLEFERLKKLNLKIKSMTAQVLLSSDAEYNALYHLWHSEKSKNGNLSEIELGLSVSDLMDLEEKALTESPSELHFAELLQLQTLRQRITNRWAVERMLSDQVSPLPESCAPNLFSFKQAQSQDFVALLSGQDKRDEFFGSEQASLNSILLPQILNQPLFTASEVDVLLKKYFNHWSDFKATEAAGLSVLPENYYKKAPQAIIDAIESQWSKRDAMAGLHDAHLVLDSWDRNSVVSRIASQTFHYHKKMMIDALVNEAVGPETGMNEHNQKVQIAPRISYVKNHLVEARAVAEKLVNDQLGLGENAKVGKAAFYQVGIKGALLRALESNAAKAYLERKRLLRFAETFNRVKPSIYRVVHSDYNSLEISKILEEKRPHWKGHGLWSAYADREEEEFQLGRFSITQFDLKPLQMISPMELTQFYQSKLQFFSKMNRNQAQNTMGLAGWAKEIESNSKVSRALNQFFSELSNAYFQSIFEQKLDPSQVTAENSPLSELAPKIAMQVYQKFNSELSKEVDRLNKMRQVKVTGAQKRVGTPIQLPVDLSLKARTDHPVKMMTPMHELKEVSNQKTSTQSERKALLNLYVQAMSILNLGSYFHEVAKNEKLELDGHSAIEEKLNHQSPRLKTSYRLVQSLLDQKILAKIIRANLIEENPIFSLRKTNTIDAPILADSFIKAYDARTGVSDVKIQAQMLSFLPNALQNQSGLVEEACAIDPTKGYQTEGFKNIFASSPALRAYIVQSNKAYTRYDHALTEALKSKWQKIKEATDPSISILGVLVGVAAIYFFAPLVMSGLSWMSLSGATGLNAFMTGFGSSMQSAMMAGGLKGLVSALVVGKASWFVGAIFIAQSILHGQVNLVEMPGHLKYQMKVAQAQVGVRTRAPIQNSEVMRFAQEVQSEKVSTYFLIGFNAIMVPGTVKSLVSATGRTASKALDQLATLETSELAQSMRQKTLTSLIERDGVWSGTTQYVKQKFLALAKLKKINTLGSSASAEKLRTLLQDRMAVIFTEEPEALFNLYETRLKFLDDEGLRVTKRIQVSYLKEMKVLENGEIELQPEFRAWVKDVLNRRARVDSPHARVLIEAGAFEEMRLRDFLPGLSKQEKQEALILFSYVKDLKAEAEYYLAQQNLFNLLKETGELRGRELLDRYFSQFGDADWARMEQVIEWYSKQVKKPFVRNAEPLREIKESFKSYAILRGELGQIESRFWSWANDEYFSRVKKEPETAPEVSPNEAESEAFSPKGYLVSTIGKSDQKKKKWIEMFVPLAFYK